MDKINTLPASDKRLGHFIDISDLYHNSAKYYSGRQKEFDVRYNK